MAPTAGQTRDNGSLTVKMGKMRRQSGWVGPPVEADMAGKDLAEEESEEETTDSTMKKEVFSPLATHLPDQVVESDHSKIFPHMKCFQAGVLFLDISGFTALCEKFSMASKNGTDKLTKTLNGYMGKLAQEIINFDGDIMKYAGDAILTLWPVNSILDIQPTLWHMYQCCMSIQKQFGKWETDVGVILKVKIGVSFGDVAVCYVGNDEYRHYVTNGKAIEGVNLAEKFCTSGDVVFSPSAWPHIRNLNIPHTLCADGEHVYVHELHDYDDEEPREVNEFFPKATILQTDETMKDFKDEAKKDESYESRSKGDLAPNQGSIGMSSQDIFSDKWKSNQPSKRNRKKSVAMPSPEDEPACRVRKSVVTKMEASVGDDLRLFITLPVLQKLDHNQPLAYLSEMRQVSILFINITMEAGVKISKWRQCKLLHAAFGDIYPATTAFHGCMNKIFMFDKGITFLVLFGLPGYKQENDCMHALQCAYRIKQNLDNIPGIECVSIGVTTGSSFCGVVGHDHRHEYTVIGRKVNMAARLMMHYPDCITCDHNTYYHSKLPKGDFVVLEAKQMKGLVEIGTIRQYCEGLNGATDEDPLDSMKIPEFFFPIIGRENELEEFREILADVRSCKDSHKQLQMLLYKGEAGIGRTRLLCAITEVAMDANVKVISTALTMHDRKTPYFTVKNMMMGLIGLSVKQSHQERELSIRQYFTDPFVINHLCMLNDLLGVKFKVDDKHKHMDMTAWTKTLHDVFSKIAEEMCKKFGFVIFAIDDGHFMDDESWDFIVDLSSNMRALVVVAIKSGVGKTKWCDAAKRIMNDSRLTMAIEIKGLTKEYLAPLACQCLKVVKVPKELEELLKSKSHGVPWWCEQIIWQLQREHCISVVKDTDGQMSNTNKLVSPESRYFIPRGSRHDVTEVSNILHGMGISDHPQSGLTPSVCVITKKFDFHNVEIPDSIKGIILARLDSMDTTDQMVVKCASILGVSFTQTLLCSVLPKVSTRKLGGSIRRLMKQNIFLCDQNKHMFEGSFISTKDCTCNETVSDDAPDTGVYCQFLRFESSTVQETAYEMFVENTRQHLHRSAAIYYEQQAHRCQACGGGTFLSNALHDLVPDVSKEKTADKGLEHRMSSFLRSRHLPRRNRVGSISESTSSREKLDDLGLDNLDIRSCQCAVIQRNVYPQLVRHWRAVADIEKTFYYLLESAAAAMAVSDNLLALSYLREAEMMVENVSNQKNPFTSDYDKKVEMDTFTRWDKARLQSLLAQAQHFLGQIGDAKQHVILALKLLYNSQPQTRARKAIRLYQEKRISWLHEHFPKKYLGKVKETRCKWLLEQSHVLSHLFQMDLANEDRKNALLTALQLVNCAEKVYYSSHELIVAYTSMLEYSDFVHARGLLKKYERKARQRCEDVLTSDPNLQDVLMVIHVYITILYIRSDIGPVNEAVGAGLRAEHLSSVLHDKDHYLELLPRLIHVLLESNRLHDAIDRLMRFGELQEMSGDMKAKIWYHMTCMELVLNACIQGVQPLVCGKYGNQIVSEHAAKVAPQAVFAFAASLALWYARTGNIPRASHWMNVCRDMRDDIDSRRYDTIMGQLRIQETKLIMLARAIAWGIEDNIKNFEDEINHDFKLIKDTNGGSKPRLLLLQSYFALLRGQQFISNRHLSASISISKEQKMTYMSVWGEACQKAWSNGDVPETQWFDMATKEMPQAKDAAKKGQDMVLYILPLPSWYKSKQ